MEIAYNGTAYHGWQYQPNAITVQQIIEDACSKLLRGKVDVVGAGRTDTGVHAAYFVVHFDTSVSSIDNASFVNKINRILPRDIVVYSLNEVESNAHSRFDAISRTYEYRIILHKNPFTTEFVHRPKFKLDFKKMNEACNILFEFKDFTSFSKLHTDVKTNNCKIYQAEWLKRGEEWVFIIKADRFLRNMVRAIVGTLLDIGRGKMTIDEFRAVILEKNRSSAGASVPANALFLTDIEYPENIFKPQGRLPKAL